MNIHVCWKNINLFYVKSSTRENVKTLQACTLLLFRGVSLGGVGLAGIFHPHRGYFWGKFKLEPLTKTWHLAPGSEYLIWLWCRKQRGNVYWLCSWSPNSTHLYFWYLFVNIQMQKTGQSATDSETWVAHISLDTFSPQRQATYWAATAPCWQG